MPHQFTRRSALQLGVLGLGILTFADLLRLESHAAQSERTGKSIIMVYLPDGPGTLYTYAARAGETLMV